MKKNNLGYSQCISPTRVVLAAQIRYFEGQVARLCFLEIPVGRKKEAPLMLPRRKVALMGDRYGGL